MKKQIIDSIKKYNKIIIHRHVNPDGDAYGSSIGLKEFIKLNYPDKKVFVVGKDHPSFEHLGKMDIVDDQMYNGALVIVTDCGNVERIDDQRYSLGDMLIKIDHHPNVTPYGDICWVDPTYTSASEMIADLTRDSDLMINKQIGMTIFFGIVTDSLRFLVKTVSPRTFSLASYLLETGFDLDEMYLTMYNRDLNIVKAQSELIETMKLENKVGSIYLTKEIMNKYNIPFEQNGLFANLLKDINGIDIWVTFALNENNTWRVEFRSKRVPINEVAIKYGGGGHKLASGAVITDLKTSEDIIKDLQNLLK